MLWSDDQSLCNYKFNTPHTYERFVPSVDTAECQLSTLNAFFVWEKMCAMFGKNYIQFE